MKIVPEPSPQKPLIPSCRARLGESLCIPSWFRPLQDFETKVSKLSRDRVESKSLRRQSTKSGLRPSCWDRTGWKGEVSAELQEQAIRSGIRLDKSLVLPSTTRRFFRDRCESPHDSGRAVHPLLNFVLLLSVAVDRRPFFVTMAAQRRAEKINTKTDECTSDRRSNYN